MQNKTCFLLSYNKYGDNDAFLHCFSAEEGYQSFFAKGIYSSRNKKKPYLFPLNLLNISVINRGNSKPVSTVSKLELAGEFYDFNDVKINSILFFVAEFLHQILRNEDQNKFSFAAIHEFREKIKVTNYDSHIELLFRFLEISGIAPLSNEKKYLDPESGTFNDEISNAVFNEEMSDIWKNFLMTDFAGIHLKRSQRNAVVDSLMIYYHYHFTGFYTPNSLAIVRQIFE
ncbi:recombination protein O N-terminal domain-containing protein [Kaistella sp. G5-32]|uniref:Recombination protein O N-terminal domain-containing protein n=1 Tax=Kaistella gelatinilytica TaxID=2787636 RepID=A0ABS0FBD9_9FLAO|nr:recombination protein O N-terminal domain-containing protein [Kaistella gelatinilytica]MBF8457009.1 recombination protein O N-terminal domain-containing protein [Kaistella gelatinilytica]